VNVDLHIHSTASDGKFSPGAVVRKAVSRGLSAIALTDHDSIDGIYEALETARAFPQIKVIPGVEISTDMPDGEAHVLGYFIDFENEELKATLERFRNSRVNRAQKMVEKLRDMGVRIDWERVREIAGDGSVGRPHVAEAMLEKGYIGAVKDAFDGYIEHEGPAYVEREKITPVEAVELVVRAEGLPVLAHPFTLKSPESLIAELKSAGLKGIEAYYGEYSADDVKKLVSLADRHGLIKTGGSDYHGLDDHHEIKLGDADVPISSVEDLISLASERGLRLANLR